MKRIEESASTSSHSAFTLAAVSHVSQEARTLTGHIHALFENRELSVSGIPGTPVQPRPRQGKKRCYMKAGFVRCHPGRRPRQAKLGKGPVRGPAGP